MSEKDRLSFEGYTRKLYPIFLRTKKNGEGEWLTMPPHFDTRSKGEAMVEVTSREPRRNPQKKGEGPKRVGRGRQRLWDWVRHTNGEVTHIVLGRRRDASYSFPVVRQVSTGRVVPTPYKFFKSSGNLSEPARLTTWQKAVCAREGGYKIELVSKKFKKMEIYVIVANPDVVETLEKDILEEPTSELDLTEIWPERPGMTGLYVKYKQKEINLWGYIGMCLNNLFGRGHLHGLKMIERDEDGKVVRTYEKGSVGEEVYEKIKSAEKGEWSQQSQSNMEVFVVAIDEDIVETIESNIFDEPSMAVLDLGKKHPGKADQIGMYMKYSPEEGDMSAWGYVGMCLHNLLDKKQILGFKMVKTDEEGETVRTTVKGEVDEADFEEIKISADFNYNDREGRYHKNQQTC